MKSYTTGSISCTRNLQKWCHKSRCALKKHLETASSHPCFICFIYFVEYISIYMYLSFIFIILHLFWWLGSTVKHPFLFQCCDFVATFVPAPWYSCRNLCTAPHHGSYTWLLPGAPMAAVYEISMKSHLHNQWTPTKAQTSNVDEIWSNFMNFWSDKKNGEWTSHQNWTNLFQYELRGIFPTHILHRQSPAAAKAQKVVFVLGLRLDIIQLVNQLSNKYKCDKSHVSSCFNDAARFNDRKKHTWKTWLHALTVPNLWNLRLPLFMAKKPKITNELGPFSVLICSFMSVLCNPFDPFTYSEACSWNFQWISWKSLAAIG